MIIYSIARMFLHLLAGMATCAFVFPFLDRPSRQQRIRRWSAKLVHICGLEIVIRDVDGNVVASAATQPALMVANHISWLDIFVINTLAPCRFVAKSDIRNWPLIGWLCAKSGTIFISRGRPRDVRAIYQGLVASIKAGDRIAFFPEGTTAGQGSLLPFHPNLFEAAIDAAVPVQPYALRYLDAAGDLHPAADFVGDMTIVESILAILKARAGRPITVELTVLAPITSAGAHRRELSLVAHEAIAHALGHAPAAALVDINRAAPTVDTPPESANGLQDIAR